mmetsp:Transcript_17727/g.47172  ORF Transcript_17727/g.47172 Transcript_17727/m.47172 type:complete len:160 (+) Transcript_17727:2-481(+)
MMQQEAVRLRSQLITSQASTDIMVPHPACTSGTSSPLAFKFEIGQGFKLVNEHNMKDHNGRLEATKGFSCQCTEEGSEPPLCLSRQSTVEQVDSWDDLASVPCSNDEDGKLPGEAGEDEQPEITCEAIVKHTFISVEPVKAGSRHRTRSAPVARHHGIA